MAQRKFIIDGGFSTNADSNITGTLSVTGDILKGGQSVATEASSQAYTDAREVAITTAFQTADSAQTISLQAYADTAEADANAYTDSAIAALNLTGELTTLDTSLKAYADQAEADAITAANAYTDGRETAITTAYTNADTTVLTNANAYTDGREVAITTAYTAADTALDTSLKAYADTAEADAVTAANAYTDGRETAITTAYTAADSVVATNANAYTDAREVSITAAYTAADSTTLASANSYTDARETAITAAYTAANNSQTTALQAYADTAEADAKAYADTGLATKINLTEKGAANGVATLDGTGKVPSSQLPSYVDDVLEYANFAGFPVTGEAGKLYVALDTNDVYRWTGSAYVKVSDAVSSADQATKLATARTIAVSGAVTGSASFDGTSNITIATTATNDPTLTLAGDATGSATFTNLGNATLTVTVVDDSHNHVIANVDGLQAALDGKQPIGTYDNYSSWTLLTDSVSRGGITSGESVNFVGGSNVTLAYSATNNTITINSTDTNTDTNNYVTGLTFNTTDGVLTATRSGLANLTVDLDGRFLLASANAVSASKWATARTLTLSGDVTGSVAIDGSANVSMTTAVANDSHDHTFLKAAGVTKATAVSTGVNITGNLVATGDVTAYSDERLKDNIEVIADAGAKVAALKGVTFTRKEDGGASTGLIAQDVLAVLPEAIETDAEGMHAVKYGNLVGLLVEAIKELQAEVAALKAK